MIRIARVRTALAALILGSAVALPLTQGTAPHAAHAASGPTALQASLLGTWHNADRNTRSVTVVKVTYDSFWHHDNAATWAKCSPEDCFWGTQEVTFDRPPYGGPCYWFNTDSLRVCVNMARQGGSLAVTVQTDHLLWDNRPDTLVNYTFLPGA